ncbi:MAG: DUF3800 domain-containing protein [Thiohalocapsa sp.]|nr:DUF3800 domain-containing protein [Thiohalocapsa sp.]
MTSAGVEGEASVVHYFVDEAGDPTLFDRKGRLIIGNDGCSRFFMLGKLEIDEPDALARQLSELRQELLADPYFKAVPSMQPQNRKTALSFHAKDDIPEVRREVYRLLLKANLRFYAVVRDKTHLATYVQQQNARDPSYRYSQNEQYDLLVQELFGKLHHMAEEVRICFAKRGNKSRNAAFREALEEAATAFARSFGFAHPATNDVVSSTPPQCPGLQAADYYLWALQRFYERREQRFLELIWPQVGEIHDLDRLEKGRRGVFYTKQKPLTSAAFDRK